mgnify:CR=1 FL=1
MGELIQFEMSIKNPTSLLVGIHIFNLVAYFPIVLLRHIIQFYMEVKIIGQDYIKWILEFWL